MIMKGLITTGNLLAALIVLITSYLLTTGCYRATMVLDGDRQYASWGMCGCLSLSGLVRGVVQVFQR